MLGNDTQDAGKLLRRKQVRDKRGGNQLVGTQRSVMLACNTIYIDDIVQIAASFVPETLSKMLTNLLT